MPDIEGSWEEDKEKIREGIREYRQTGSVSPGLSLSAKMEYTFWTGAVLSVAGMLVSMYFIDASEQGMLWLWGSLGLIMAFSGLALAVRMLPEV